jgi:hypothetical protein
LRPAFEQWAAACAENRSRASRWSLKIAGRPVGDLRAQARAEMLEAAARFSVRLKVEVQTPRGPQAPLVMTGHQPELYHPGIWAKDFLLQRLAAEAGATAIDLVVDSDGFDAVAITAPCLRPEVRRCRQYLAVGAADGCYACAPVPDSRALDEFCAAGEAMLATLPTPSLLRHFDEFCTYLRGAAGDADSLAELVTFARRRYEAAAGTDYLELPVTELSKTASFLTFVAHLALDAERFVTDYNAELQAYRRLSRTRSSAQPFPDLRVESDRVELPLWALDGRTRLTVWAERSGSGVRLVSEKRTLAEVPFDPREAVDALRSSGCLIAPKALALTLFVRLVCCDYFIHGVGGGRYDAVTDGVCRRHFGVEPPAFAVASLTMYLPLGGHVVTDAEIAAARERVNRLEHNPNEALGDVEFETPQEGAHAATLAARKAELVAAIGAPDADRKLLGARIREMNAELNAVLAPVRAELEAEVRLLEEQRAASEILVDRTYPFCFWSPAEVSDKTR